MKRPLPHLFERRIKRKKGDTARMAAQLAPLEEQRKRGQEIAKNTVGAGATQEIGAIVVDRNSLNVPKEIVEVKERRGPFGLEPLVLVILAVVLTFIGFITWQISQMPPE